MKHKVLISFASSSIMLSIAQLVANVLVIRWVPPEELGIWHTVVVLKTYALILNLGTSNGLNRELPFLLGKNHQRLARATAQSALFVSLIAATLAFIAFALGAAIADGGSVKLSLFVVAVVSSLTFVNIYYGTTFRTNQAFYVFSKINIALIAIELVTLVLPAIYGFHGFLSRLVVIEVLKLSLFLKLQPFPVLPKFRWTPFKYLIITGVPLFVSAYLSAITDTLKRVILKSATSFEMVGLFAPALAVYSLSGILPQTLGRYIFPKLSHGVGQGASLRVLWLKNLKFCLLSVVLLAPAVAAGYFLAPAAIDVLFPAYAAGSRATQIATLSALFIPFAMLMNFFHAIKHWVLIYTLTATKLLVFFLLQWAFVRLMPPLTGIATGTLIAQVVYSTVLIAFGFWYVAQSSQSDRVA